MGRCRTAGWTRCGPIHVEGRRPYHHHRQPGTYRRRPPNPHGHTETDLGWIRLGNGKRANLRLAANKMEVSKLDESRISNPKSRNFRLDGSNLHFRNFGFEMQDS